MGKGIRSNVLIVAAVLILAALGGSTAFSFLFPSGSYEGGEHTFPADGKSQSFNVTNDSNQVLDDIHLEGKKGGQEFTPTNAAFTVGEEEVSWSYVGNKKKWKADSEGDRCPKGGDITVDVTWNSALTDRVGHFHFTNKRGSEIVTTNPVTNDTMCQAGSRSSTITTLYSNSTFDDDNWSTVIDNQSDYLITAITFSESPSLGMDTLYCSELSQTDPENRQIDFEYYLAPNGGEAKIDATYVSVPTQTTTVSCAYTVCEALPESANRGFAFDEGTGISVPNITIEEVVAGALDDDGGTGEIILRPRERFDFAGVTGTSVASGNIVLDSAYVSNGDIHIPILVSSSVKSKVTITGITINTVTGLSEGTVSVRMTEPSDNNCNFPYANFDPEE